MSAEHVDPNNALKVLDVPVTDTTNAEELKLAVILANDEADRCMETGEVFIGGTK